MWFLHGEIEAKGIFKWERKKEIFNFQWKKDREIFNLQWKSFRFET